jgi:hypothetical protein
MNHFCTYFDRHYLVRGLTLYRSLQLHANPFTLSVLCLDDFTYQALAQLNLPELQPFALAEFERGDEALLAAKEARTAIDYYFTCSPSWIRDCLSRLPDGEVITYLDADLYFYSSPVPLFDELGNNSILIIGHRFPPQLKHLEKYGVYNVGFLSFRRDSNGCECLKWWRERCIEWCFDRLEGEKFADQKYLDDWPSRFAQVVVAQHKGANLAPWNWAGYNIRINDGYAMVNGEPLIFYHFHGLKLLNRWIYLTAVDASNYGLRSSPTRDWLYGGYVRALKETAQWASRMIPEIGLDFATSRNYDKSLLATVGRMMRGELGYTGHN